MQNKSVEKQREHFNKLAPHWRDGMDVSGDIISLLELIDFKKEERVLDVACGAGILEPFLEEKCVFVDATDVSEKMIERAKEKWGHLPVNFFAADFYTLDEKKHYDKIIVFDAFPHFIDRKAFALKCAGLLKKDGQLWILMDNDRDSVNAFHGNMDKDLYSKLLPVDKEAEAFAPYFDPIFFDEKGRYVMGFVKK